MKEVKLYNVDNHKKIESGYQLIITNDKTVNAPKSIIIEEK